MSAEFGRHLLSHRFFLKKKKKTKKGLHKASSFVVMVIQRQIAHALLTYCRIH